MNNVAYYCILIGILIFVFLFSVFWYHERDHMLYHMKCFFHPSTPHTGLPTPSHFIRTITDTIHSFPPMKYTFIDFGCGEGAMIHHVAPIVHNVIGIELNTSQAESAKECFKNNPSITILAQDMVEYEFSSTPTILYMYEPLWTSSKEEARSVYNRVFTNLSKVKAPCYVIYVSGMNSKMDETGMEAFPFTLVHQSFFRRMIWFKGNRFYVWKRNEP